jgi:hypothetical protein
MNLMNLKSIAFVSATLLLSACADLGPIREYAKASSDLTAGKEIVTRWKNSDDELAKANELFPDYLIESRRCPDDQKRVEAAADDLYKVHDALGEYFAALSLLAADELPSTKTQGESLSDAIGKFDANFSKADQTAFTAVVGLLSIPLEAYRQKEVIELIKSQDANIQKLLTILEQSSLVIESDLKGEAAASTDPYYQLLGDVKDKGVRFLVRERMYSNKTSNYQAVLSAITKYRKAIATVKAQHKKIAELLASDKENLRQAFFALRDARKQIISARNAVEAALD